MSKASTPPRGAPRRPETAETSTYLVGNCPINHDGDRYETGDPIELTDYQAKRLAGLVSKAPADTSNT